MKQYYSLGLALALFVGGLASVAPAQSHSVIVSPDLLFQLRDARSGPLSLVDDQETLIVTPSTAGGYAARPFRTVPTINVMHGDRNNDGDLDHITPYVDLNCLMRRTRPPHVENGPFEPGSIWMSAVSSARFASSTAASSTRASATDGDVWRARNGVVEYFVRGPVLAASYASATSSVPSVDVDGLVQTPSGDLLVSFYDDETIARNAIADGDLYLVPAAAITYDGNGLVSSIARASARLFASEADFDAMVANSGAVDINGTPITAIVDLTALAIDPSGGTWISPRDPTLSAPNLVFGIPGSDGFDNLWSTAAGGRLAVINGVTMGHRTGQANGDRFGIWPMPGTTGVSALLIVPAQSHWITMDAPLSGKQSGGLFQLEIGRMQPSTPFVPFVSLWATQIGFGYVPALPAPGGLGGNRWLELDLATLVALPPLLADADGIARLTLRAPPGIPSGVDFLVQGAGLPVGGAQLVLSATCNMTF